MTKKNWQIRAHEFALQHNLMWSYSVFALDTMSELGAIAEEFLQAATKIFER